MMALLHPTKLAFWGWLVLIWGAPWSHAAMSLGTGLLAAAVISQKLSGEHGGRMKFSRNAPLLWLIALIAWQGASLLWTENLTWGLTLMAIQMAMVPLAWAQQTVPMPVEGRIQGWLFHSAMLALAGVLVWGIWRMCNGEMTDGRSWTPFMSHVRLSMFAALAMVWGAWKQPRWQVAVFAVLWAALIVANGSLTGALLLPLSLAWIVWDQASSTTRKRLALSGGLGAVLLAGFTAWWLQPVPLPMPVDALPAQTALGNPYEHRPALVVSEGGHRVHLFLCEEEWEPAWRQISAVPFTAANTHGFSCKDRLPRYLTSLGWPKDAEHILKLTPDQVAAIENGATNARSQKGLARRVRELRREWEIWLDGGNPSGHSVVQRFEHWTAGLNAWLERPFIGHGMGDTPAAMANAYRRMDSQLSPSHRHRAHMQHLTWGISGGLMGLLLWLGFWHSWWKRIGSHSTAALWGGVVLVLSCVFEDTWETQAGIVVSFLALFGATDPSSSGQSATDGASSTS